MITTYTYAFTSVIVVSLVSLIGVFSLSIKEEIIKKYIDLFISLAVGALLGDAFIHLLPEIYSELSQLSASLFLIFGILFFFTIEKFMHWHHHGEENEAKDRIHPVGRLLLFTDGFHNFTDGIIIGASYLISIPIGLATTLAVIFHEIPQEIGDFAVLIHSGYERRKALWLNFLSALTAVLGVLVALIFGSLAQTFTLWVLPIATGGFIYIAVADLIPELRKNKNLNYAFFQILSALVGIGIMLLLLVLE